MSAPFKYYFSNEHTFLEKRGGLIRQKGSANSAEALFRA